MQWDYSYIVFVIVSNLRVTSENICFRAQVTLFGEISHLLALSEVALGAEMENDSGWKKYKREYHKRYSSKEEPHRYNIYKENLREIEEINSKNLTWTAGVHQFTDMTWAEFKKSYLGRGRCRRESDCCESEPESSSPPTSPPSPQRSTEAPSDTPSPSGLQQDGARMGAPTRERTRNPRRRMHMDRRVPRLCGPQSVRQKGTSQKGAATMRPWDSLELRPFASTPFGRRDIKAR